MFIFPIPKTWQECCYFRTCTFVVHSTWKSPSRQPRNSLTSHISAQMLPHHGGFSWPLQLNGIFSLLPLSLSALLCIDFFHSLYIYSHTPTLPALKYKLPESRDLVFFIHYCNPISLNTCQAHCRYLVHILSLDEHIELLCSHLSWGVYLPCDTMNIWGNHYFSKVIEKKKLYGWLY